MSATTTTPIAERLSGLRAAMRRHGLTHYVIPSADPHQSEYVPAWWRRREWASGFTGSAGTAVVGLEGAWLWTDSRYFLQAEKELDGTTYELMRSGNPGVPSMNEWLADSVGRGVLGFDPRTIALEQERAWRTPIERLGGRIQHVESNLVDELWQGRPEVSLAPFVPLPVRFSGEAPASKIARVQGAIAKRGCDALVVTMLDAIAWLFDLRGSDVEFNPVGVAQALVTADGATLFVDERKVDAAVRAHLPASVTLRPYDAFGEALDELARRKARAWIEPQSASAWIAAKLAAGASVLEARSPITDFKARKNAVEVQGARDAHVRDGVAMVRFLSWLHDEWRRRPVSEIAAADKLAAFRAEGEHFRGLSFETISGFGSHGAIIHYRPAEEGDRVIDDSSLLCLDSGGQYLDGTTDITRTICLGIPTREQVDQFTRVLRGHVAIARVSFPQGTSGKQIDVLARLPLWEQGRNFGHGTGHGVGAYLNVHEGPQRIATKGDDVALEPGMLLSNEPGYYVPGSHGIRTESIIVVVEKPGFGESEPFLGFETLTCCPIDRKLIDADAMLPEERRFIDDYHAWVRATLSPLLDERERAWLHEATQPL